jgi:hypothetical protein
MLFLAGVSGLLQFVEAIGCLGQLLKLLIKPMK